MPATNPPSDPAAALQWLVDREAIRNLVLDFARCLDDTDTEGYLANFTEDAVLLLPHGRVDGLAQLAQRPAVPPEWTAQHLFGNITVDLDGDVATARAYLAATHIFSATDKTENAQAGGWYDIRAVRTPQGWRFSQLELTILWEGERPMIPADMAGGR